MKIGLPTVTGERKNHAVRFAAVVTSLHTRLFEVFIRNNATMPI
jgi:hypothetical protein